MTAFSLAADRRRRHSRRGLAAATLLLTPSLLVPFAPAVRAQETVAAVIPAPGITVSGTGEVRVRPDIARMNLGVETQDPDPQRASAENAREMDAIIKNVRALGVEEKDVRTGGYSISPQYDYGTPNSGRPPRIIGYQVSNSVEVTVRKIGDAGRVLDAAVKAGANAANGIEFDINDEDKQKAQDEALSRAVADAARKAKVIARAANAGRLDLVSVTESGGEPPVVRPMFRAMTMAARAPEPTPVAPGEQTITASVTARYAFNPAQAANY